MPERTDPSAILNERSVGSALSAMMPRVDSTAARFRRGWWFLLSFWGSDPCVVSPQYRVLTYPNMMVQGPKHRCSLTPTGCKMRAQITQSVQMQGHYGISPNNQTTYGFWSLILLSSTYHRTPTGPAGLVIS